MNGPWRFELVSSPTESIPDRRSPDAFAGRCVILIPALNEAEVVSITVRDWLQLGFAHVRVVDNGSTDATAVLAREAGAEVVSEKKRGYGSAAWTGLQNLPPGVEWVLFSSADGSDLLTPEELAQWTAAARDSDLILGDRCSSSASTGAMNLSQRVCTVIVRWVVRIGWGRTLRDVGSLRAVRVRVFDSLQLTDRGFGWNVEMQIRAIERGLRITELSVCFRPRRAGQSKISGTIFGTARAATAILGILFRLWQTRGERRRRDESRS